MKLKVNLISSLKGEVHSRGFKENGYSYLRSETIHRGDSNSTIGGLQSSREVTHFVTKLFFNHESVNFIYMHAECKSFEKKKNSHSFLFPPPFPSFYLLKYTIKCIAVYRLIWLVREGVCIAFLLNCCPHQCVASPEALTNGGDERDSSPCIILISHGNDVKTHREAIKDEEI